MHKRHPSADEPLTFTYRDVADLLQSAGYDRFAKHVRQLGDDVRDKNQIDRQWREKYAELVKRLHVYEPPPAAVVDNGGKPGLMSDG